MFKGSESRSKFPRFTEWNESIYEITGKIKLWGTKQKTIALRVMVNEVRSKLTLVFITYCSYVCNLFPNLTLCLTVYSSHLREQA